MRHPGNEWHRYKDRKGQLPRERCHEGKTDNGSKEEHHGCAYRARYKFPDSHDVVDGPRH